MVVYGHGQHLFGVVLANHVIIENRVNLPRTGNPFPGFHKVALVFLADDVHAEFDAFIADEDGRPGNQLADFMLALAAE